jgi:hypothetical protein
VTWNGSFSDIEPADIPAKAGNPGQDVAAGLPDAPAFAGVTA